MGLYFGSDEAGAGGDRCCDAEDCEAGTDGELWVWDCSDAGWAMAAGADDGCRQDCGDRPEDDDGGEEYRAGQGDASAGGAGGAGWEGGVCFVRPLGAGGGDRYGDVDGDADDRYGEGFGWAGVG